MGTRIDSKMQAILSKVLGHGAFGVIYSVKNNINDVIKVIDLRKVSSEVLRVLQDEISLLPKMAHKNIIVYKQIVRSDQFLYIRMPYYPETLRDVMIAYASLKKRFTTAQILLIIRQVCEGLAYLHNPRKRDATGEPLPQIIHRDLKPENILVTKDRSTFVLADFGLCRILEHGGCANTIAGTPPYTAPEIRLGKEYDTRVDMWSLGVLLYELVTGRRPDIPLQWNKRNMKECWRKSFAQIENKYIRAIVSHLLIANQNDRYTAAKLLQLLTESETSILLAQPPPVSTPDSRSKRSSSGHSQSSQFAQVSDSSFDSSDCSVELCSLSSSTQSLEKRVVSISENQDRIKKQLFQLLNMYGELQTEHRRLNARVADICNTYRRHSDAERAPSTGDVSNQLATQLNHINRDLSRVINGLIPIETRMTELCHNHECTQAHLFKHDKQLHEHDIRLKLLEELCDELKHCPALNPGFD